MSDSPGQFEGGPQVEMTLYTDATTVELVHERDLWMVAYTRGDGAQGAIDHIDTSALVCEVGSAATDEDVVAYIENRLGVVGYSATRNESAADRDRVMAAWDVTPASEDTDPPDPGERLMSD